MSVRVTAAAALLASLPCRHVPLSQIHYILCVAVSVYVCVCEIAERSPSTCRAGVCHTQVALSVMPDRWSIQRAQVDHMWDRLLQVTVFHRPLTVYHVVYTLCVVFITLFTHCVLCLPRCLHTVCCVYRVVYTPCVSYKLSSKRRCHVL